MLSLCLLMPHIYHHSYRETRRGREEGKEYRKILKQRKEQSQRMERERGRKKRIISYQFLLTSAVALLEYSICQCGHSSSALL